MNQYLQLETSPVFVILCLLAGIGYAYVLYRGEKRWSSTINKIFFVMRALLVASIAFLLLGPIVKRINNIFEKPVVVIVRDNSASIKETTDSTTLHAIGQNLESTA